MNNYKRRSQREETEHRCHWFRPAFLRTPENDICNVKYVVEADPNRAAAAREIFGCETLTDYRELFAHKNELDFVTNAFYSDLHYPITRDLLAHGFNVLCEKPLCKTPEMVQDLIDTAKANNVLFTIFHQYKFNDYYIQMKRLLAEGVIGDVKLARVSQNAFARRYDWQTLLYRDAGTMRNNAAHYIEQIMDLAGSDEMPKITSHMDIWNSVGDAEDYMFARFHYSNGTIYEMEVNPSDAYASEAPIYKVNGAELFMKPEHIKAQIAIFNEIERQNPLIYKYEKPADVI